jgi:hypothetical protein
LLKREGYGQWSPIFAPILGLRMVGIENNNFISPGIYIQGWIFCLKLYLKNKDANNKNKKLINFWFQT